MAEVHSVRVSYLREKQPRDFEKITPMVEFAAQLESGEDHQKVAASLMRDAAAVVHAGMGINLPKPISTKLGFGDSAPEPEAPKATVKPKAEERQISETPEDRVNPEDEKEKDDGESVSETKEEEVSEEEAGGEEVNEEEVSNDGCPDGLDHKGLHAYMVGLVQGKGLKKKVDGAKVKEMLQSYDIARMGDLPVEKIPEVWGKLKAMEVEANK